MEEPAATAKYIFRCMRRGKCIYVCGKERDGALLCPNPLAQHGRMDTPSIPSLKERGGNGRKVILKEIPRRSGRSGKWWKAEQQKNGRRRRRHHLRLRSTAKEETELELEVGLLGGLGKKLLRPSGAEELPPFSHTKKKPGEGKKNHGRKGKRK